MKASEWLKILKDDKSINTINKIVEDSSKFYGCDDPILNLHDNHGTTVLVIEI